jgi:hypothetical protein
MSIHLFLFAVSLSLVAGSSWERTVLSCTVQRALLAPASAADLAGGSSTSQRTRQPLYRSDITIFYSGTHFLLTSPCLLCRSSTRRTVLQSFCTVLHHFVSFYHISSLYCVVCPCEIHHADAKVPLATLRDRAYSTVCTRP